MQNKLSTHLFIDVHFIGHLWILYLRFSSIVYHGALNSGLVIPLRKKQINKEKKRKKGKKEICKEKKGRKYKKESMESSKKRKKKKEKERSKKRKKEKK